MKPLSVYPRTLAGVLLRDASHYPVCTVIGPRQSGKTTLVREIFPDKPYTSLEAPDVRTFAREDPRGFLAQFPHGAVLDEFQRVPELLSYIQTEVDDRKQAGRYILTGSQNFLMMRDVSQSLAGRTSIHTLYPLSLHELADYIPPLSNEERIQRGFYPGVHSSALPVPDAYRNYFNTYVERDVRNLLKVHDLHHFETFVRLCAGRIGQLLNLQSLANDTGISATTVREWLSLLETSFLLYRLPPWHANIGKRLVKSPKLYFVDVGLAAYLIGIEQASQITTHPLKGNLFENLVVSEFVKHRLNHGKEARIHFYRDSNGREVDVLFPLGPDWLPVEIKSGQTITPKAFDGLRHFSSLRQDHGPKGLVVYGGDASQNRTHGRLCGLGHLPQVLQEAESLD